MSTIPASSTLLHSSPPLAISDQLALPLNVRRVVLAALTIGVLLFLSDHDWSISKYEDFSETADAMQAGAAAGNLLRSAAIGALGLAGFCAFLWRGGYPLRIRGPLAILMLTTIVWCAASWLWSIEPAIAARRLIASACLAMAALGAARWLTPRELAAAALSCAVAYLGIGALAELSSGTFQPWRADYRFAGTLHPNHQGLNAAVIVMAATYLAQYSHRHRVSLWSLAALGLATLWMTKSRTPLAALVVAESIYWFLVASSKQKLIAALAAIGLISSAMLLAGDGIAESLAKTALLGRADEEEVGALSGRVSLWEELSDSIARRPLAGYGFNSFWIPRNIEDISDSQSWAISVAHSTYFDLTLGIGLIGAVLCVVVLLLGLFQSLFLNAHQPALGYGFIAVVLLFALLHGLLESAFANPGFAPLVMQSGLAMLAFVDPKNYSHPVASSSVKT